MNLFALLFLLVSVQQVASLSACFDLKTCGACISYAVEKCVWCSQESFAGNRCQPETNSVSNSCESKFLTNPNYTIIYAQDDGFNDDIQFRPQFIKIKARPGVKVDFEMSYKPASQYPLDVYFLMDYSDTMINHREALQSEALAIYKDLTQLTDNVQLGVGSFIEKPGLPYADVNIHYTYAFKNHLSLTKNMIDFEKAIKGSKSGANYDDPEAGLDALMQVMKCERQLGWRNNSRRIIVLATDSTYHSAGDGKMVGAMKLNDMTCHLDDNEYKAEYSLKYDYPSVSQINKVAVEGKYQIIFAAIDKVSREYEALAKQIVGANYAKLKTRSNIADIIRREYLKSVSTVDLQVNPSKFIQFKKDQDCLSKTKKNCESTHWNPTVTIPASIKSTSCATGNALQTIYVTLAGLQDRLKIEFDVDCECDCEKIYDNTTSTECSSAGIKQCGVCKCNPERAGTHCQWNCNDENALKVLKMCKQEERDKDLCNNHGECSCGVCVCPEPFSGKYCQYDNTKCPKLEGKMCGGRGVCVDEKCNCDEANGWTGDACQCPNHNRACIGPFSEQECSGRGRCECGRCVCNNVENTNATYMGVFCDTCEKCANERCEELKDYVYCNHENEKDICDAKFQRSPESIDVTKLNKKEFDSTLRRSATKCRTELPDNKVLLFKYYYDSWRQHQLQLIIQNELEKLPEADIWVAIGSALGAVILIGLLTLLIWKILIDIYDKREYERFCKQAKSDGYEIENPIFISPVTQFINPHARDG